MFVNAVALASWALTAAPGAPPKAPRSPCEAETQKVSMLQKTGPERLKGLRALAAELARKPGCGELLVSVRELEGETLRGMGKGQEAAAALSAAVTEWRGRMLSAEKNVSATEAAAHAAYLLALDVSARIDAAGAGIEPRMAATKAALSALEEVLTVGDPRWSVSALARRGERVEEFAGWIRSTELTEPQRTAALALISPRQQGATLEACTVAAWGRAAALARNLSVTTEDAQLAAEAEARVRAAQEAAMAPPPAPPPQLTAPPPTPPVRTALGLEVGIKVAGVMPVTRTGTASAVADGASVAGRSLAAGAALTARYRFAALRALAVSAEGGYVRMGGSGTRALANDPDFGAAVSWSWQLDQVPVLLGLAWELPLPLPVRLSAVAGGAAVYSRAQSSYTSAGQVVRDAPQAAWALGAYGGAEAALPLGPGALTAELRFLWARTDFGLNRLYGASVNAIPGEIQGTNLLAGYRFSF